MSIIRDEPVLVTNLITAAGALVIAFGLRITAEQLASIVAVWLALAGLLVRSRVTPVK